MSRFEYLSVLISIVIGLGISEVASAWGRILRHRALVDFSWIHAFWSLFIVLLMIQFWWGFWEFRVVETWSFPRLLAVVVQTLVLVTAALVLTPGDQIERGLDPRAHYLANSRLFFSLGLVTLVLLATVDTLVGDQPFWHAENAVRATGVVVAFAAAWSSNLRLHQVLAAAAALLFSAFVVVAFAR